MKVYPKQIVYCPAMAGEQNGGNCPSCAYYETHGLEETNQLFISCSFNKGVATTDLCQLFVSRPRPSAELVGLVHPLP